MQVVALPSPVAVKLSDYSGEKFSDAAYLAFCRANPNLRVERTAEGEILIVPPAGSESSYRNTKVTAQLDRWAEEDSQGRYSTPVRSLCLAMARRFLRTRPGSRMPPCATCPEKRKDSCPSVPNSSRKFPPPPQKKKKKKKKKRRGRVRVRRPPGRPPPPPPPSSPPARPPAKNPRVATPRGGGGPVGGLSLQLSAIWKGLS